LADPAVIPITADRRVPYVEPFAFIGNDLTSAVFAMQVRETKDTAATPLLNLANAGAGVTGIQLSYAGTATAAAHVSAGRLPGVGANNIYTLTNPATGNLYQPTDNILMSQIIITILANFIEALPFPDERGEDPVFYYDLISDTPAGNPEILMAGTFTVRAGVTIP
jgi:hypothetical protein